MENSKGQRRRRKGMKVPWQETLETERKRRRKQPLSESKNHAKMLKKEEREASKTI